MASSMISWFVFVFFTSQTTASHFRGGIITWKPDEYIGNKVKFNFRLGFRRSASSYFCDSAMVAQQSIVGSGGSWSARHDWGYYGSLTVADTGYHCTDFSVSEDWTQGENSFNYTFPNDGPWLVSYSSCCWISLANGGGNWFLSTTVNLTRRQDNGKINSSPISALSPIVRHQRGCSKTVVIPAEDSDGDKVRCRWSTGSQRECGGVCQRFSSSGTLDEEKCTLRLHSNAALGWHAVAITLEDFPASTTNFQTATPFSHVSLQFLVHVASSSGPCNRAPLLIGRSPNDGSCEEVPDGGIFYSIIEAKHVDSSRRIAEIITVTPLYMNLTNLLNYTDNVGDNVYYKNVSWSPKSSQKGRHIFCFKAIDDYGMESDQRCITILVGTSNTPRPILSTRTPLIPTLYWPLGSGFVDFNITFDQQIKRPRHSKFIRIILQGHEIYKLDTRSSSDVTIDQNGFTLRFSLPQVVMSMRGNYSVTMDRGAVVGLGCTSDGPPTPGISSTKSWPFNVGVCSKGTFIADGNNCDDVDECSNPSSILSRKKRNIWYWPYSSATPLFPVSSASITSTVSVNGISPTPSLMQGYSASITSAVSVSGSCPYFKNGQLNGRFTSPNYPSNYGRNERCSLLIEAPHGHYIYLQFRSFSLEYGRAYCPYDYVEIFDGNSAAWSSRITKACGQQHQAPCEIYSSGRFLYVKFTSDGSGQSSGFSAYYYALSNSQNVQQVMSPIVKSSCNIVASSPLISSTRASASSPRSTEIRPTPSFTQGLSTSVTSTVSVSAACSNHSYLEDAHRGMGSSRYYGYYRCDNNLPSGWYRFRGAAGTEMPTSCIATHRCGTHAPGWLNGAHPSVADGAVNVTVCFHWNGRCCSWSTSIRVRNCGGFYVYELGPPPTCYLRYCGNGGANYSTTSITSVTVVSPTPASSAPITSSASVSGSCSYYLNHHYGNFKSPNYPSNYRNNEHCTWLIEVPRGYYIYLNFGSLDLERCYNCGCDVVKIFDGNSTASPMIKRACGHQTSGCGMYSSGRFLFVQFSSDGSYTLRGFSATFSRVSYNYGNSVNQGLNSGTTLWCTSSSTPFHPSIHSISATKSSAYIPWTVSAAGSMNIRASTATVMPTASRVPFVLHLPANCQHNCVNTWGSYYCTCRQGYKLQADEKTCVDINECETQNGGCTHQCVNTPGSHYCKCREGTTMNIDNKTCHEPGINVRCTDETMSIFLERKSFKGFDPNTLTLFYPSCRASYNDTHITLRTSLNDCGTTHNESEDAITFYNEVRSVQFSPGNVITRDQNVSIPFYCSFGRKAIVRNPSFKTWKNYVTSSEGGYGNFTFTMDMFRTSNYYTPYGYNDYPITVTLQDRLFLQIAVKSHQSNLVVFVDTCKATPSTDPYSVPQYIFIQRGCGLDSTLNYSYSINSKQRFSIQAFRFIKDHPVVHFHCEVLACHRNTARSRCLQGCSSRRGRRDEDPGSESTQVYEMSSGPIKFQKTNPGKMDKSTDVQTNMGLVTGVAAAGGLFLFLAIALAVAVVQVKKRFKGALADRNRVYAMEQFSKYVKEEKDNDGFAQDDDVNESGEQNFNKKASA